MQNGISTPSQPPIIIPLSAERPAGNPTPSAKQSAKAFGREPDLDPGEPAEPAGEKIIFETSKRTGKRVSKKVLVEWSEGPELDVARMIVAKKQQYLSASSGDAFCKDIKKDLKRELNFKPSNLHRTIFSTRNGVGSDGKPKILLGWVGKRRRFLAGRNEGTGREQYNEFDPYVDDIINIVKEKKRKKKGDAKTEEQLEQEKKDKYKLRTSMLKWASKRRASELDSVGNSYATDSTDDQSRDVAIYQGSYPGRSRERALLDSASIINSSNEVFQRYFELQESAAASRERAAQEELRLREMLEIQRRRIEQEDSTAGELKKRLDESEEIAKRRNQEQNSRFDRLEDLLVRLRERKASN